MMPRQAFVIRDRLEVQEQALFRTRHVDVDVSRTRSIGSAAAVVGRHRSPGAVSSHWNYLKPRLRQASELARQILLYLVEMRFIQCQYLFSAGPVELAIGANRFVEAVEIFESHLLR